MGKGVPSVQCQMMGHPSFGSAARRKYLCLTGIRVVAALSNSIQSSEIAMSEDPAYPFHREFSAESTIYENSPQGPGPARKRNQVPRGTVPLKALAMNDGSRFPSFELWDLLCPTPHCVVPPGTHVQPPIRTPGRCPGLSHVVPPALRFLILLGNEHRQLTELIYTVPSQPVQNRNACPALLAQPSTRH